MNSEGRDFNNLKQWLVPLLTQRKMSIEKLANEVGVTRATVYHWMIDTCRPTEEVMVSVCQVLDRPLEEALAQYTPRPLGRPRGSQGTRGVTVRGRR